MKKISIFILIVGIIGLGYYLLPDFSSPQTAIQSIQQPQNLDAEGGPAPLSLLSFAEKEFSGSDFRVGTVLDSNESYTRYYITYKSGSLKISGIMNVPRGSGPFPVLILNHGYIDPAVYTNGRGLKREQDYLARRGYVVIHPDYRNHADSDKDPDVDYNFRLGYMEDVINLIDAVQKSELSYFDKEHIGMLGHSMGGGVAQTVMVVRPELVDAFVLFAPVSSDYRDNFEKWTRSRVETAERIVATYGSPSDNPTFWESISPATFFENVSSPIMIHHGTEDESVPLEWSQHTYDLLLEHDKQVTFYIYNGEKHEFINQWPLVMDRTVNFFDDVLK